jgi:hypothetical protein
MTRVGSALLVILAAALAFSGAGAAAAPQTRTFHPRYRVVGHDGQATDGLYTILWSRQAGVIGTIVDERTGARTLLTLPAGCANGPSQPTLGDSWLLVDCARGQVDLYSPAAAQWRSVAVAPACANFRSSAGGCIPIHVGTDWIEYDQQSNRFGDRFVFQNIASGALRKDPSNRRTIVNLDSPTLAEPVCGPLRVPREGTLEFAGRFAVADGPSGTFLERCGTRLHLSLPPDFIALTPHAIVTIGRPTRALGGILLPSLRRFTVALPPGRPDVIAVDLSRTRIYVDAMARSGAYNVWSAPTPVPAAPASTR